jgi:hypothetical protein
MLSLLSPCYADVALLARFFSLREISSVPSVVEGYESRLSHLRTDFDSNVSRGYVSG